MAVGRVPPIPVMDPRDGARWWRPSFKIGHRMTLQLRLGACVRSFSDNEDRAAASADHDVAHRNWVLFSRGLRDSGSAKPGLPDFRGNAEQALRGGSGDASATDEHSWIGAADEVVSKHGGVDAALFRRV
jgi:hypothetical protein